MELFGLDLRYLMLGCLTASLLCDLFTLKSHPLLTLIPLIAGLVYHLMHETITQAIIALLLPFAVYLITLLRRRIAPYDVLDFSMIGVIMGWPFSLITMLISKGLMFLINNTLIIKILGRRRARTEYDFPYTLVMVAGAALTYWLFRAFPQIEKLLHGIYP